MSKKPDGIKPYKSPAGGWGALRAVADVLSAQETVAQGSRTLLRANQPDGFDCPGCAWPDPRHTSSFEFCENGAKAVAWEATSKRAGPEVFARYTVNELWAMSDHALEDFGRLTEPMAYDRAQDRYVPVTWDSAFAGIGAALRAFPDPNMVEFYASGRMSNEAAFLYQLLGRAYGTNNFPDCSNMCHEPTSVGLPASIGMGKGTVTLDDFEACDLILSFGHNPGTNHPRMMGTLRAAARRGAHILVFNPMKERALERFASPQDPLEMATLSATPIAHRYYQLSIGGDVAVIKGIAKALFAREAAGETVLDHDFIAAHTEGFEAFAADVAATDWADIESRSGLSRAQIEEAAGFYAEAKAVILCYGMGITQHEGSSSTVQQLANLLFLRGNIGRPGAGICPLRGHSNVQGARTVGVAEKPSAALLDSLDRVFSLRVPRNPGHTVVEAIRMMREGRVKALISLGGNFAVAAPDPSATFAALRGLELTVNVATKLNRTHLLVGRSAYLLPCLGRTEIDLQATGEQAVTVEDSMSMVHASRGRNHPASDHLRSEPAIIAGIAKAVVPDAPIDWDGLVADYDRIRDAIEAVFPESFAKYNARIRVPGGFRLPVPPSDRVWKTARGRAQFLVHRDETRGRDTGTLLLTTVRSHDQYNTTIYGMNDRYRGVFGRRDVVFVSPADLEARGLADRDLVDIEAVWSGETMPRMLKGFLAVARDLPPGSCAAYYPETNALVALDAHDRQSGTPAYKSIPIRLTKSIAAGGERS